jgi:hypothetical protein
MIEAYEHRANRAFLIPTHKLKRLRGVLREVYKHRIIRGFN